MAHRSKGPGTFLTGRRTFLAADGWAPEGASMTREGATRARVRTPRGPWTGEEVPPALSGEFAQSPGARWIRRTRTVPLPSWESVRRRVDAGIPFGVAVRIWDARGRTLLVRPVGARGLGDVWMTPGGGGGPGELPAASLRREVEEETGGTLRDPFLWKVFQETVRARSRPPVRWFFLQYVAQWGGGRPRPRDRGEIATARWFRRLPANMMWREDWIRAPRPPGHDSGPGPRYGINPGTGGSAPGRASAGRRTVPPSAAERPADPTRVGPGRTAGPNPRRPGSSGTPGRERRGRER